MTSKTTANKSYNQWRGIRTLKVLLVITSDQRGQERFQKPPLVIAKRWRPFLFTDQA